MKKIKIIIALFWLSLQFSVFAQTGKPQYQIRTERADTILGYITIELFPAIAPLHSAYFDSLVNISFYDSTAFHRVIPDFVIQGGDPNSKDKPRDTWGEGDSSQATIPAEFSGVSHQRGIIGAARDEDINSANSQFYVNLADNNFLDWNYTAFGQVIEGMDVVDFISLVPRDANDNPDEKIEMFISKTGFTNEVPEIPVLSYPKNGEVGILNLDTLTWGAVDGAVMYSLQISKSPDFDSLFFDSEVGFNFYQLRELQLGNIDFYWRVKANNGGNVSEYSDTGHFVSSIEAPILVYPEMNDDSISIAPEFRWMQVDGATKYRLQISRSPLFQEKYIVYDVDTITVTYHTPTPLEPKKSYYWRVFSMTDQYQGPKSEFRRFVTPDVTDILDEDGIPDQFSLGQNFPNPFNPVTTINYQVPKSSVVTIKVYNILGSKIRTLINKELNSGSYKIQFDASDLPTGMYIYELSTNKFTQSRKMLLLK